MIATNAFSVGILATVDQTGNGRFANSQAPAKIAC
jgi:hypothetical protein